MTIKQVVAPADWHRAVDELIQSSKSSRSVHRPILMLYLLSRARRGEPRAVSFAEVEKAIADLLLEHTRAKHVDVLLPFWHLQSSGFWTVEGAESLLRRKGKDRPTRSALVSAGAQGSVSVDWWSAISSNIELLDQLAEKLLRACIADEGDRARLQSKLELNGAAGSQGQKS